MDIDEAYQIIGEYGPLQRKLFWALCLLNVYQALHQVHMLYVGAIPKFNCITNTGQSVEGCGKNVTCPSYHYDSEFTSIVSEWDLVCVNGYKAGLTQSFIFGGILTGCFIFGSLSDKFGRRRSLTAAVGLFTLFALISPFSNSYWMFTILRFLTGIFNGGAGLVQFVLAMELIGASWRNYCGNIMPCAFSFGIVVYSIMAYFIRDWRTLSFCTAVPGVLFLTYYYLRLPESPRWLLAQGKISQAEAVIQHLGKGNHVDMSKHTIRLRPPAAAKGGQSHNMLTILRHPLLWQRNLIQIYAWFVNSVVYYGLTMSAGSLGSNMYLSISLSGIVELPAYFLAGMVLDRLGRRKPFAGFMVIGGVACLAILAVPSSYTALITILALLGKIAISASFSIAYIYSAELYPTVIRNNAIGMCTMATRVGGVVSPMVIPLDQIYPALSFLVFGSLSFTAGLVSMQLPETLNQPTMETLDDLSVASSVMRKKHEYGSDRPTISTKFRLER